MMQYTQTLSLLKANLKRDWLKILVWLLVLAGIFIAVAAKFEGIYGSRAQIQTIAQTLKSAAMTALFGPITHTSLNTAIIFAVEMAVFWAIFMVIFNYAIAVGASRGQEESGLTEMILGGHPVGRLAPISAVALELVIANGLFAIIAGIGMQLANMPGSDTTGNWLFAISLAAVGWMFGMISLVFSQLVADSHNVLIYGYSFFGLTYLVRMMTDVANPDYTWWSPFGWIEKTNIYVTNNWLPVWLFLGLGIVAFAVAVGLNVHRDIDAGIIQVRGGKRSSRFLRGPATLLFWNQKSISLFWIIGMAVLGASYGSVFNSIGKLVNDSPIIRQVLGQSGVRTLERNQILSFVGILGIIFTVLAAIGGAMVISHLYTEEQRGYLQLVNTTPHSRYYLLLTYVAYGVALAMIILFAALMTTMMVGNATLTQPLSIKYYNRTFVAMLPVLMLFISALVCLVGVWPKFRSIVWLLLGSAFIISYFGRLINLPKWAMKLSPFYWFDKVPIHELNLTPVMWLLLVSAVLLVIGFVGYGRRDLEN
ncbi:ABC transporter permease [Lentilactobacillus fungorum]|uniref:ABC transporter permease n=1 Tax=Lentilactobacillus fungorum TaxID=2201250 RepID=A0ABQ3W134_9LACO|nr:ABC transporter permease [Lentilactobacillus fungorum]GHP14898.1 ABC transporter permease [Lentilactobacillus fungorum]